jgi:hypothetical protein
MDNGIDNVRRVIPPEIRGATPVGYDYRMFSS